MLNIGLDFECDEIMSCDRDETEFVLILAMESTCDPKGYYDQGSDDSDEGDYGEGSMSLDIAAAVLLSDGSVAAVVSKMSA